jgi:hypothetical protein
MVEDIRLSDKWYRNTILMDTQWDTQCFSTRVEKHMDERHMVKENMARRTTRGALV